MLIQVILAETTEQLIEEYRGASPDSDLVEMRLDRIRDLDLESLLSVGGKPRLATCRSHAQGGFFGGTEEERRKILEEAVRRGVEYVDLEFGSRDVEMLPRSGSCRRILSYHHRPGAPLDLEEIYRKMAGLDAPAILKLIPYADSCTDNLRIRDLLRESRSDGRDLIAFCMGEKGKVSRILARAWGSWAVYAPCRGESRTAPGQLLLAELIDIYRVRELEATTPLCGIVGFPVSGSLSPRLYNVAFARLGLPHRFLPFETETLAEFLPILSELPVAGFSVTHPHKESILAHCDDLDPLARRVGAVNTVVRRWNRLVGYNTDVEGAVAPLRRAFSLKGARVGILGSGGAARAVAHGLIREGASVTLFARNAARAQALAQEFGCRCQSWSRARLFRGKLLINATPVGMSPGPDESAVAWDAIRADAAYDLVYNPSSTRFLQEAEKSGAQPISGIEMFLEQALLQFELLSGRPAPRPLFEEILSPFGRRDGSPRP